MISQRVAWWCHPYSLSFSFSAADRDSGREAESVPPWQRRHQGHPVMTTGWIPLQEASAFKHLKESKCYMNPGLDLTMTLVLFTPYCNGDQRASLARELPFIPLAVISQWGFTEGWMPGPGELQQHYWDPGATVTSPSDCTAQQPASLTRRRYYILTHPSTCTDVFTLEWRHTQT